MSTSDNDWIARGLEREAWATDQTRRERAAREQQRLAAQVFLDALLYSLEKDLIEVRRYGVQAAMRPAEQVKTSGTLYVDCEKLINGKPTRTNLAINYDGLHASPPYLSLRDTGYDRGSIMLKFVDGSIRGAHNQSVAEIARDLLETFLFPRPEKHR